MDKFHTSCVCMLSFSNYFRQKHTHTEECNTFLHQSNRKILNEWKIPLNRDFSDEISLGHDSKGVKKHSTNKCNEKQTELMGKWEFFLIIFFFLRLKASQTSNHGTHLPLAGMWNLWNWQHVAIMWIRSTWIQLKMKYKFQHHFIWYWKRKRVAFPAGGWMHHMHSTNQIHIHIIIH